MRTRRLDGKELIRVESSIVTLGQTSISFSLKLSRHIHLLSEYSPNIVPRSNTPTVSAVRFTAVHQAITNSQIESPSNSRTVT